MRCADIQTTGLNMLTVMDGWPRPLSELLEM